MDSNRFQAKAAHEYDCQVNRMPYHAIGNINAPVWFIGVNSAGDRGQQEKLDDHGKEVLDITEFHEVAFPSDLTARWGPCAGNPQWGPPRGPTNDTQTYRHQSRLLEAISLPRADRPPLFERNHNGHVDPIRNQYLGRSDGPSLHTELYSHVGNAPPPPATPLDCKRVKFVRKHVENAKLVVCYGWGYRERFRELLCLPESVNPTPFPDRRRSYLRHTWQQTDVWIIPFLGQGQISLENLRHMAAQLNQIQWR